MTEKITITLHGNFEARCPAYGLRTERKKHGVVDSLCRELLAAGASPKHVANIVRDGTKCFEDATIGQWASRRLTEHDRTGFNQRAWKPRPDFEKELNP